MNYMKLAFQLVENVVKKYGVTVIITVILPGLGCFVFLRRTKRILFNYISNNKIIISNVISDVLLLVLSSILNPMFCGLYSLIQDLINTLPWMNGFTILLSLKIWHFASIFGLAILSLLGFRFNGVHPMNFNDNCILSIVAVCGATDALNYLLGHDIFVDPSKICGSQFAQLFFIIRMSLHTSVQWQIFRFLYLYFPNPRPDPVSIPIPIPIETAENRDQPNANNYGARENNHYWDEFYEWRHIEGINEQRSYRFKRVHNEIDLRRVLEDETAYQVENEQIRNNCAYTRRLAAIGLHNVGKSSLLGELFQVDLSQLIAPDPVPGV